MDVINLWKGELGAWCAKDMLQFNGCSWGAVSNDIHPSCLNINIGVPQGSIFGPLVIYFMSIHCILFQMNGK